VPQYTLASYLGMSTEFLSRIRSKARKKEYWFTSTVFFDPVHFFRRLYTASLYRKHISLSAYN
jgi:hypothetical protein